MSFLLGIEAGLGVELDLKQVPAPWDSPSAVNPLVLLGVPRVDTIGALESHVVKPFAVGIDAFYVPIIGITEGVPNGILDHPKRLMHAAAALIDRLIDLLRQSILALEPVFQAS
jgi:hypothetical protein